MNSSSLEQGLLAGCFAHSTEVSGHTKKASDVSAGWVTISFSKFLYIVVLVDIATIILFNLLD
jgi:hypothetical protein